MDAPEIITAEDIVARLRQGIKERYSIEMRGVEIPVRILSCDEVNKVRNAAARETLVAQGDETDKNIRIQKATLALASQVPPGSPAMLGHKVLDLLTVDELGFLFDEYIGVMEQVNPSLEAVHPDEFKAIVDALKKKAVSPKELSLRHRNAICEAFVDLIQKQENPISQQDS